MPDVLKESFLEHQKSTRLFVKIGVGVLVLLFLLLPGLLRGDVVVGDKVYYHLRMSEGGDDSLSFSGRDDVVGIGWNFLLKFIPLALVLFVLGLGSIGLFFLNLGNLSFFGKFLATGFFVASPAFIYFFNVGERFGFGFFLSLLVVLFLMKKKYFFSLVSLSLIFLFDYFMALFVLFGVLCYFAYLHKKSVFSILMTLFVLFVLFFGEWNWNIISDLGANIGISIFALLFVVFSFLFFWNQKKFLSLYGLLALLFLFSLKTEFGILYFSAILSILMALCFVDLYGMKWESRLIRDLTLLIIVCGLLFSGLSYVNRLSEGRPIEEVFEALNEIPEGKVVFSGIEYGNWISFSGKKNVWDSFSNVLDFNKRERDFDRLVKSRDVFEVIEIFDEYKVDYVFVDRLLKEEWGNGGLLYLLRYDSESFRKVYDDKGIEIWRYYR